MDLQPVDYVSGLGELPNPLKMMQQQQAFRAGLQSQQADAAYKTAAVSAAAQKLQRQADFQSKLQSILANPNAQAISSLMAEFPEFADELKASWDLKDKDARQADFTQLSEMWAALDNGHPELAAKLARQRFEADQAAGNADDTDRAIVDALESGDPQQIAQAKGLIGMHVSAAGGAEHFASVHGAMKPGVHEVDGILYDDYGRPVSQSPYPRIIPGTEGSFYEQPRISTIPVLGGGSAPAESTPAGSSQPAPMPTGAPQATVAATLTSAGLPSHVVAGFLGNFDVEGGYQGAAGDGGSSKGIAQWRESRAENFQRVMGKPIANASHDEQAQFVVWELQHPEAAGMTIEQRDQILNARSPQEAAALIDKFYERSSGDDRSKRVAAAKRYAQGGGYYGGAVQVRSKQQYDALPAGATYIAPDGSTRVKG